MKRWLVVLLVLMAGTVEAQIRLRVRTTPSPPLELRIVTESLPDGPEGVAYACTNITATGGTTPYTWSTSGTLPTGITITDSGDVAVCGGTPTVPGTYAFTLIVTDNVAVQATKSVQIVVTPTSDALPSGWTSADLGSIGSTAGTIDYTDNGAMGESLTDTWDLTSSAPNITGTADSFRYACKAITGDAVITAQVTAMTGYTFGTAGVMIRETLTVASPHMYVPTTPLAGGGTNQRRYRVTSGGTTTNASTGLTGRFWLRVERVGDVLTGYISTDGTNWTLAVSSVTITMTSSAYACLATTSIPSQSPESDATFTNVTVDDAGEPPPAETDFGGYRSHFQGFGAQTKGGLGGEIRRVNTLTDEDNGLTAVGDGTFRGSFREAIKARVGCVNTPATCARIVVFEISGTSSITGNFFIDSPYLTVAGQTAPAGGFTMKSANPSNQVRWFVNTHDVVLQHFRMRPGFLSQQQCFIEALRVNNNTFNVVLDHMTFSWAAYVVTVNNFTGTDPTEILITDSMISEPIGTPAVNGNPENPCSGTFYGMGTLWHGSPGGTTGTLTRNLYAHVGVRSPLVGVGWRMAHINNVAYNWHAEDNDIGVYSGSSWGMCYAYNIGTTIVSIGNVFKSGPNTHADGKPYKFAFQAINYQNGGSPPTGGNKPVQVHLSDNSHYKADGTAGYMTAAGDQWATSNSSYPCSNPTTVSTTAAAGTGFGIREDTAANVPWWSAFNFQILPNADVEAHVLANVGARPTDRDVADARIITEVTNRTGSIIAYPPGQTQAIKAGAGTDSQGYPIISSMSAAYSVPAGPHDAGTCGSFWDGTARSKILCQLETDARSFEPAR